jgi:hypothetical protein
MEFKKIRQNYTTTTALSKARAAFVQKPVYGLGISFVYGAWRIVMPSFLPLRLDMVRDSISNLSCGLLAERVFW